MYVIRKGNDSYGQFKTIEDALFERDRLVGVNWDIDAWCELPDTPNNYIHIDLPPFEHKARYIVFDKEHWIVMGKGRKYRYYGTYYSKEEALTVCRIYDGRIIHYDDRYRIQKRVNGKNMTFGYFDTYEEAEERLKVLKENGWKR